jgi:hypothetical protein
MRICELGDGDGRPADGEEEAPVSGEVVRVRAKRALVGAGARVLFYPTLLYNVLRNQFEAEFRWWDRVDQVGGHPAFTRIPSVISFARTMCLLVVCLFPEYLTFFLGVRLVHLALISLDNNRVTICCW